MVKIGDPGVCYFCGEESCRTSSSATFDLELDACDNCGEASDGLLLLLERRRPSEEVSEVIHLDSSPDEVRALEYDSAALDFERRALGALEDLFGLSPADPVLVELVQSIAASATAETCARLIRLGKI